MKTKNTALVILNTITFVLMLFINYASNAHVFSDTTVADIAHKYDTLFAPADYAFIIWSIIFLLCLAFVIYQWVLIKVDSNQYIQRTGPWFAVSNIANAAWVYCWVHEWMGWSVILILVLLFSLVVLTINLRLELDDEPVKTIFFVWWPIVIYLGWIIVATVACIASWLVYTGWDGAGTSPPIWTIIMIIIASFIYIFLVVKRNMREAAAVGAWAFIAIAVRHWGNHTNIIVASVMVSLILLFMLGWHAHKNSHYRPGNKIKRGEW